MAVTLKREGRFTYGEYCRWNDGERWELIDGIAYNMTPAPTTTHQRLSIELSRQIANQVDGHPCEVFAAPFDVRLPFGDEADEDAITTVVQPDIVVVCDGSLIDERGCRGAPDFVVEIASPSSVSRDSIKKVELYERHGVKEYWIVHPADRLVYVRRLSSPRVFGRVQVLEATGVVDVVAVPGLTVDLARLFETLD